MGFLHHPKQETAFGADEGVHFFVVEPEHSRFHSGVNLGNAFDKFIVFTVRAFDLAAGQHVFNRVQRLPNIFL